MANTTLTRTCLGAGRWFPDSPVQLRQMIGTFLAEATPPPLTAPLLAAIAPHAGYPYSGPAAAYAYKTIALNAELHGLPETVVVLGFSHREAVPGVALMDGRALASPLDTTLLDNASAGFLVAQHPRFTFDYRPHQGEHSLENQVPFIQTILPNASLVMALVGPRDSVLLKALATALNALAAKKKILVVASSDMLHDASYETVCKTDRATLQKVARMDIDGLAGSWDYSHQVFCGIGPVLTTMYYAQQLSCRNATLLHYRNSGDDFPESRGDWVVGYGAVAFTAP